MLNFRLNSMEDLKLEDDEAAAPTSFGVGPLLSFLSNRELGTLGRLQVNRFLNPFCFACPLPWVLYLGEHSHMTSDVLGVFLTYLSILIRYFCM